MLIVIAYNKTRATIKEINMLIAFTGNECTYKTTMAQKLSNLLEVPLIKGSSFEFGKLDNFALFQAKAKLLDDNPNVVFDRFIYCNRVYASLYKDNTILSLAQVKNLELRAKAIHGSKLLVIYCSAPAETLRNRMLIRGDEYVDPERLPIINKRYEEVITKECKLPMIEYHSEREDQDYFLQTVIERMKELDGLDKADKLREVPSEAEWVHALGLFVDRASIDQADE